MRELNPIEKKLLEELKRKVETIYGLGNSLNWAQKDYEYLVFLIENKTGIQISLSTLKRIWKNQYNRLPQIATLDALAQLSFKMDWLSLKKEYTEKEIIDTHPTQNIKKWPKKLILILSTFTVCCILVFLFIRNKSRTDIWYNESDIEFSCKASADGKIPNTVVFSYDVKEIEADKFFIQQSWDKSRRVEVSKYNTKQTDIYYTPGFYSAKLFADDKVIKEIPVHIVYNHWFMAAIQNPKEIKALNKDSWLKENYLGISNKALKSIDIDMDQPFRLNYYNVRDFNVDGDNFSYSSSFRMDSLSSIACPSMSLWLKGEHSLFKINFGNKGCESNINILCSDIRLNGKTNDLCKFGCNIYHWQELRVTAINKTLIISLNDIEIFKCSYNTPIGNIKAINFSFIGIGHIDNIELKNAKGEIKFYDDFQ